VPLIVEGRRTPPAWAHKNGSIRTIPIDRFRVSTDCVRIAFINNMPDPALEDTEVQFFELLNRAAGEITVRIKLYSLPGIPRSERGREHLKDFYLEFADLWNSRFHALIVTGTEPHTSNLRDEPYWPALVQLLDWAERNTISTILSCLAAHASAFHGDGIERNRLNDKQCGVFDFIKMCDHTLTREVQSVRFPHSRWNELRPQELRAAGYVILTESAEAGADCFIKQRKESLFVHFQGHPEYSDRTLLKEYRRDVKRFLRHERETYPSMPRGYFDASATQLLKEFRNVALSNPSEEVFSLFPQTVGDTLQNGWHSCATSIYKSWLGYVNSKRLTTATLVAMPASASASAGGYKRRSAVQ